MRQQLSASRRLVLGIGLTILVPLLVAGGYVTVAVLQASQHYAYSKSTVAPASLNVQAANTAVTLSRSSDGQIHLTGSGSYTSKAPSIRLRSTAGGLTVASECESSLVRRCRLHLQLSVPTSTAVAVHDDNGSITAAGLTGSLQLHSTNGGVRVDDALGPLDLRSTNGSVQCTGLRSTSVAASTTNGQVRLTFIDAPLTVDASTTNGEVTVRLPAGESYSVDADTVNGDRTVSVPVDVASTHRVRAHSVNGSVTVEAA